MAVSASDIKYYHSGGAGNTDPNLSLGGTKSTTEITDAALQNLFDNISSAEAAQADYTNFRCFYIENTNSTDSLFDPAVHIEALAAQSDIQIGLDPAGKNGTATVIGDEETPPAGVSFTQPTAYPGLDLSGPDDFLGNGEFYPVWIRRINPVNSTSDPLETTTLRVQGDTA